MLRLNPEILRRDGKNQFVVLPWEEFVRIKEELEDLEDIRLIDESRAKEGNLPGLPLEEVKRLLEKKWAAGQQKPKRKSRAK